MKFKVGDRVAVYNQSRKIGVVDGVHENGRLTVRVNSGDPLDPIRYLVMPEQCRKLVKGKRRRVWMENTEAENLTSRLNVPNPRPLDKKATVWAVELPDAIEFIEVTDQRSGKKRRLRTRMCPPRNGSGVRRICIVCKASTIPKQSPLYDGKVCKACLPNLSPVPAPDPQEIRKYLPAPLSPVPPSFEIHGPWSRGVPSP